MSDSNNKILNFSISNKSVKHSQLTNLNHIKRKINSYKYQDIKMNRVIDNNITYDQLINKLQNSNMTCYYCNSTLNFHGPLQWTLDRKENHIAHTNSNTVISCLRCNLKKRRQCTERFINGIKLVSNGILKTT